mmetsp:Transcript_36953/g.78828  ORF Transcript_36953/g.78828 Transcript_36953/m.78828 type:complete len:388 (+) Transcript_36953:2306-3469(+)
MQGLHLLLWRNDDFLPSILAIQFSGARSVQEVPDDAVHDGMGGSPFRHLQQPASVTPYDGAHPPQVEGLAVLLIRSRLPCQHPVKHWNDLVHPLRVHLLEPQLVVPLREHVLRGTHVRAQRVLVLHKRELERAGRRVGEVVPQKGEVDPRRAGRVGGPAPRDGDGATGFVLGGEGYRERPRSRGGVSGGIVGRVHPSHPGHHGRDVGFNPRTPHATPRTFLDLRGGSTLQHERLHLVQCSQEVVALHVPRQYQDDVVGCVVLLVVAADPVHVKSAQVGHLPASFGAVPARGGSGGVEEIQDGAVNEAALAIFPPLHLAVNHPLVLSLAVHVVNLRHEAAIRERRKKDVVREYRQQVQRPLAPGRAERVRRVVRGCPRIGPVGHASVG